MSDKIKVDVLEGSEIVLTSPGSPPSPIRRGIKGEVKTLYFI